MGSTEVTESVLDYLAHRCRERSIDRLVRRHKRYFSTLLGIEVDRLDLEEHYKTEVYQRALKED